MSLKKMLLLTVASGFILGTRCCSVPLTTRLTERHDGADVTLCPNGQLLITLESNATTGFAWELAELDTSVLENTHSEYTAKPLLIMVPGAGGVERWWFSPVATGTTVLRLEYRQPWDESSAPAETFEITVTVE